MTTITLPRAVVEQALEALKDDQYRLVEVSPNQYEYKTDLAIAALERALAQQAEPVEPVDVGLLEYRGNSVAFIHQKMTAYRTGIDVAWDAFRAKGLHPDGKTSLANMIAKYTAPRQQQAEPVEPVAWLYTGIKQDGTTHGPHLVWKPEYMDAMSASKGAKATPLYTAPPQRKPLTEEKILDIIDAELEGGSLLDVARAVERAHGIGRQTDPQIEDRLARHGIPKP